MKKLFLFVYLTITAITLSAQECRNFYYLLNNAEVEMTVYDAKGDPSAKQLYKIDAVQQEGSGMSSDFSSTMLDKRGKVVTTGKGKFKCNGANVYVDMQMSMPNIAQLQHMKMEAKSSNSFLSYPAGMQEGQSLPDGTFEMEGNANGMNMQMNYQVSNRKVMGNEKVTTPAGSWDCYKISYDVAFSMKVMGVGAPMQLKATEWFAPGFGVVKTESYGKNGKLAGSTLITGLKK
jgi:hypothetical protein